MTDKHNYAPESLHSPKSELGLIGALLEESPLWLELVKAIVSPDDLRDLRFKYIYRGIIISDERNHSVSIPEVSNVLHENKVLGYITDVGNEFSEITDIEPFDVMFAIMNYYRVYQPNPIALATQIRDFSWRRKLLKAQDEIRQLTLNREQSVDMIALEIQSRITKITSESAISKAPHIKQAVDNYSELFSAARRGELPTKLYTGYRDLDSPNLIGGFERGDLAIIGGDTSMGKTSFAVCLALNMAESGKCGMFVSMEMSENEMTQRFIATKTGVPLNQLKLYTEEDKQNMSAFDRAALEMSDEDHGKVFDAFDSISQLPIHMMHAPTLSAFEVWSQARICKSMYGNQLDFIIVDQITNMQPDPPDAKGGNRHAELGAIANRFKEMASVDNLDTTLIVLSQISGNVQSRPADKRRPMISDLRDSKAIAFYADLILFVYRDIYYNDDTLSPFSAEILVRKNRDGGTGVAYMVFDEPSTRFLPATKVDVHLGNPMVSLEDF